MSTDIRRHARPGDLPDSPGDLSIALVCGRFNRGVVEGLVDGATETLAAHGVAHESIDVVWAPGALEIPQVAATIAQAGRHDAIVALGAVIRGDTYHFEVVCDQSAAGLMQLSMTGDAVVTNGILTVDDDEQARVRSGTDERNKGHEAALAALETIAARRHGGSLHIRGVR
ncbi:MAG: 6,7-dimethyl-8-ribityllumazine synthase [Actinomycetota bacterium]